MNIIKYLFYWMSPSKYVKARDEIIGAIDTWMLACAVGAENGTVGVHMGFDTWFSMSKENWLPEVREKTGASELRIRFTLLQFVKENEHRSMYDVLASENKKRGMEPPFVLRPGDSMTFQTTIRYE